MKYGWDHPATARYYEQFCARHSRYRRANEALVYAADLRAGQRVLDVGAGLGDTAAAALAQCGGALDMACLEPATAMRARGEQRVPRAQWIQDWPVGETFDRILCGAAVWQMQPLADFFSRAVASLAPGGALGFNIPALYIGEPDDPGGGADPLLLQIPSTLANGRGPCANAGDRPPGAEEIEELLRSAGLRAVGWGFRGRLTQVEYRDWLALPVLTDSLLGGFSAEQRIALLHAAYARCDAASWRWEAWRGWTAWK
jgi:SAM-dependent methyltransferase